MNTLCNNDLDRTIDKFQSLILESHFVFKDFLRRLCVSFASKGRDSCFSFFRICLGILKDSNRAFKVHRVMQKVILVDAGAVGKFQLVNSAYALIIGIPDSKRKRWVNKERNTK